MSKHKPPPRTPKLPFNLKEFAKRVESRSVTAEEIAEAIDGIKQFVDEFVGWIDVVVGACLGWFAKKVLSSVFKLIKKLVNKVGNALSRLVRSASAAEEDVELGEIDSIVDSEALWSSLLDTVEALMELEAAAAPVEAAL